MRAEKFGHPEKIATALLYAVGAGSLLLLWLDPRVAARLGIEDGPVENISALLLLAAAVTFVAHGVQFLRRDGGYGRAAALSFACALLLIVFAGEEISWGQRIFGVQPGEFMQQHNWQGEINLHNLQTDVFNIAFHYGAFVLLVLIPLFRSRIVTFLDAAPRLAALKFFIAPAWIAVPSFILLGMLDSRFVFIIEKPWAAGLYLFSLALGVVLLLQRLVKSARLDTHVETGLLLLSLLLIAGGLLVSYIYAVDEQATNIISEYKELFITVGIFMYALFGIEDKA